MNFYFSFPPTLGYCRFAATEFRAQAYPRRYPGGFENLFRSWAGVSAVVFLYILSCRANFAEKTAFSCFQHLNFELVLLLGPRAKELY